MVGTTELLIILAVVVVFFGGKKLPELGKGIGEGLRNFKKGLGGDKDDPPRKIDEPNSKTDETKPPTT